MAVLVSDMMDDVADECSVTPPNSWTSTSLTYRRLKSYLRQTVDELLDRVDWPSPIGKDFAITGTTASSYDLPDDFKRIMRDDFAVYESTRTRRAVIPVTENGAWTFLLDTGTASGDRYYRITTETGTDGAGTADSAYQIEFFQAPGTDETITVSYVSGNWLAEGGSPTNTWDGGTTGVLLLPRNIVELGIVWRFRRKKGLPYADRMADYEAKLARAANDSRQRKRINFGDRPARGPFDIPIPDIIPPAP